MAEVGATARPTGGGTHSASEGPGCHGSGYRRPVMVVIVGGGIVHYADEATGWDLAAHVQTQVILYINQFGNSFTQLQLEI